MKKITVAILVMLAGYVIVSCNGGLKAGHTSGNLSQHNGLVPAYEWMEQTGNAAFPKSYNFQLFNLRDTLWAFHPAGNWFSLNGKDWSKSELGNCINNLAFLDYVAFNNTILGLGHFEGNIEQFKFTPVIYQTTDMKTWKIISKTSNLPNRYFYHPFVFKNKIWIIGGSNGNDSFADIWNSADGITWFKRAANLPFGKRENSQVVFHRNKLYMINNDVWSSEDGLNWVMETNEIVKGENIFGTAAIVFDGRIWLLGCNRNAQFKSEVLVSEDGKTWAAQMAPWSPRGGIAACVYNGKIFMTGGKYGGLGIDGQTEFVYSNDVWSLEKKDGQ